MNSSTNYKCSVTEQEVTKRRSVYPTTKQKRKLMSLVAQHPQLISYKPSQYFTHRDCEALWNKIANELNTLPGSSKTWRQWRKTWQDIRSKQKKRQKVNGGLTPAIQRLTDSEREALGWKNVSSTTNYQEHQDMLEFVSLEDESTHDDTLVNDSTISEPGSPLDIKMRVPNHTLLDEPKPRKRREVSKSNKDHRGSCAFNCDRLAVQEERKILMKEDYLNFKKDYLRQKLLLMKEQVDALKDIAKRIEPVLVQNI